MLEENETDPTEEEDASSQNVEEEVGASEDIQEFTLPLPEDLPQMPSVQPEVVHGRASYGRAGQKLS
jgi:hypothetical protein